VIWNVTTRTNTRDVRLVMGSLRACCITCLTKKQEMFSLEGIKSISLKKCSFQTQKSSLSAKLLDSHHISVFTSEVSLKLMLLSAQDMWKSGYKREL